MQGRSDAPDPPLWVSCSPTTIRGFVAIGWDIETTSGHRSGRPALGAGDRRAGRDPVNPRARRVVLRIDPAEHRVELVLPRSVPVKIGLRFLTTKRGWVVERSEALAQSVSFVDRAIVPVLGFPIGSASNVIRYRRGSRSSMVRSGLAAIRHIWRARWATTGRHCGPSLRCARRLPARMRAGGDRLDSQSVRQAPAATCRNRVPADDFARRRITALAVIETCRFVLW